MVAERNPSYLGGKSRHKNRHSGFTDEDDSCQNLHPPRLCGYINIITDNKYSKKIQY